MNWKPYGDMVLIRPLMPTSLTAGGLIEIPDDARGRPQKGVIVAVGPGLRSEMSGLHLPIQCAPGDLVLFGQYAGVIELLDGEALLIMRDHEVIAGKPAGTYELVEHRDEKARLVHHETSESCPLCPRVDLSAGAPPAGQ